MPDNVCSKCGAALDVDGLREGQEVVCGSCGHVHAFVPSQEVISVKAVPVEEEEEEGLRRRWQEPPPRVYRKSFSYRYEWRGGNTCCLLILVILLAMCGGCVTLLGRLFV